MRKRDLFQMELGEYDLTDSIDNYRYELRIGLNEDKSRYYRIKVKGSLDRDHIFMVESYDKYDDEIKYKTLTALAGVGGLIIQSNDTYIMLDELRLLARGSFAEFLEKTSQSN